MEEYIFRVQCKYCKSLPHFQKIHDADGVKVHIFCVCGQETRFYTNSQWKKCKDEWARINKIK